jgi:hypothetical protein
MRYVVLSFVTLLVGAGPAAAGPAVDALEGLDAFRVAIEAAADTPKKLEGRRFTLRYTGALDDREQVRLTLAPPKAFSVERRDRRTFVVRVERAALLVQDDFLREVTIRAARASSTSLIGTGEGRCALAVRFTSDVGRPVDPGKYRRAEIEWWPKEAARMVGRGGGHVLFRRAAGHARTPVEVRARLTLGDGSTRTTAPAPLGYCAGGPADGASIGLAVLGGGVVDARVAGAGQVSAPIEVRADERFHVRLAPTFAWWPSADGDRYGALAQAALGLRFEGRFGVRLGGEAGWMGGPRRPDAARAGGWLETFYGLGEARALEVLLRAGGGVIDDAPFAGVQLGLSWLPVGL